jgi:hypothetical protein
MNKKVRSVFLGVCALAMFAVCAVPARTQMSEVKEKPRMYTYVAFWTIPRAQWADEQKQVAAEQKIMDAAVTNGSIVAYGSDQNLIHQPDGATHDTWYSAMSMAGLLNTLDQIYKSGMTTSAVEIASTKHSDSIFVSRYYNWHSGSWKDVYSETAMYQLKADAPNDAVDTLSRNLFVPLFEKLLADGTIHEYEVDTEAIHTEAPGAFWISYVAANAEALDKVNAAIGEARKASPLGVPAFASMTNITEHRDYLSRAIATYK